jgi:hypothetical protein
MKFTTKLYCKLGYVFARLTDNNPLVPYNGIIHANTVNSLKQLFTNKANLCEDMRIFRAMNAEVLQTGTFSTRNSSEIGTYTLLMYAGLNAFRDYFEDYKKAELKRKLEESNKSDEAKIIYNDEKALLNLISDSLDTIYPVISTEGELLEFKLVENDEQYNESVLVIRKANKVYYGYEDEDEDEYEDEDE